jgi:methylase of polypeptide subunit release factors
MALAPAPAEAPRVADVLRTAGYTSDRIDALIGADLTALGQRGIPVVLHRTNGGTLLETLVRLFTAGAPVPRNALPPATQEHFTRAGLLTLDADEARATVQLACYGALILATDWGPTTPNVATPKDHVLGFSPSTLTLARMTVRTQSRNTLDLGTGAGLQALLAAAHSDHVVATDLNPRAVAMARFNASLNGITTIDCREGDIFAPIHHAEVFDTIVSNPPFVVGPAEGHLFMSAGRDSDAVCRQLAREAPRHLAPGGWCQFLANWAVQPNQDWRERLQDWFTATGCDAWVIRRGREPADEYAALWIETDRDDPAEYAARFDAWMRWYQERDIEAVDYGLVTMRRRDGDPQATGRIRCDDVHGDWRSATGADIAAAFARHDWLDSTTDQALLSACLTVSDAARLRHELVAVRGEWVRVGGELRVEPGVEDPGGIDPQGEALVARCDGTTPVGALLDDLAAAVNSPAHEVRLQALAVIRRLVDRGVLLPPIATVRSA